MLCRMGMMLGMKPHESLEKLRKEKGWSRKEVARRLDRPSSTVDTWFTGQLEPGATDILALADLFGVSVDALLGRQERAPDLSADERHVLWMYRDLRLDRARATEALSQAAHGPRVPAGVEGELPPARPKVEPAPAPPSQTPPGRLKRPG